MKTVLTALSALIILGSGQALADSSFSNGAGPEPRPAKKLQTLDLEPVNAIGDRGDFQARHYYDRTCQCDVTEIFDRSTGEVLRVIQSSN